MSRVRSLLRRRAADPLPQEAPDAVAVAPEPVAADPDPRGWDVAPPERTPAVAPAELPELVAEVEPTPSTEPAEPAELAGLAEPKTAPPMGWGAVHVGGGDLVALSHAYAAAGRLHEAALAQWAADLQLVAPHLGSRAVELCDAVESLSPLDPHSALTAARAALTSLVDADVPVLSLLGPTSHLADRGGASLRPRQMHQEPAELPADVQLALDATLEDAARQAGDSHGVSVALRRSLLRQRASRHRDEEPVSLVRGVLEPHEHQAFDHQLLHLAR